MTGEGAAVDQDEAGVRLDRWFRRHYPELGHGPLERLLRTGQVRVDGKRAKAADRLAGGQIIRIPPQLTKEAAKAAKFPRETSLTNEDKKFMQTLVLHEDSSVVVLNKPPGLATQGGSGITRHLDGLLEAFQGRRRQRPRLVHRLDRDTSGVIVVAKTVPAAAALSESLRRRTARKIYWGLTAGVPRPLQGTIRLALAKESRTGQSGRDEHMAPRPQAEGGKAAVTDYAVLATASKRYAWVALKPLTGRTHQIRAHLAAIGTPLVGDFKYGGAAAQGRGEIEDRLHLHARTIDIAHPDGGRLRALAPLPAHMLHAWKLFGFDPEALDDPFLPAPSSPTGDRGAARSRRK